MGRHVHVTPFMYFPPSFLANLTERPSGGEATASQGDGPERPTCSYHYPAQAARTYHPHPHPHPQHPYPAGCPAISPAAPTADAGITAE